MPQPTQPRAGTSRYASRAPHSQGCAFLCRQLMGIHAPALGAVQNSPKLPPPQMALPWPTFCRSCIPSRHLVCERRFLVQPPPFARDCHLFWHYHRHFLACDCHLFARDCHPLGRDLVRRWGPNQSRERMQCPPSWPSTLLSAAAAHREALGGWGTCRCATQPCCSHQGQLAAYRGWGAQGLLGRCRCATQCCCSHQGQLAAYRG